MSAPFNQKIEHWLAYAFCGVMVFIGGRMMHTVDELSTNLRTVTLSVAEVKTELLITAPKDVKKEVGEVKTELVQLRGEVVTRNELSALLKDSAPWSLDKAEWQTWRTTVDQAITRLERKIDILTRSLNPSNTSQFEGLSP